MPLWAPWLTERASGLRALLSLGSSMLLGPGPRVSALQVHGNGPVLDDEILADPEVQDAIKNEGSVHRSFKILNTDRATFGRVGGAVAKLHGDSGFAGSLSFDLEVRPNPKHSQAPATIAISPDSCQSYSSASGNAARSRSVPSLLHDVLATLMGRH